MMKTWVGLFLALTFGIDIVVAASTPDIAAYPPCAVSCIVKGLPQSPCTGMNQTCLCADPVFNDVVGACLKTGCTVKEQLSAANLTWVNCGFQLTDNTKLPRFLTGLLFILPTVFIIIRLANKWVNPSSWAADDLAILLGYALTVPFLPIIYRSLELGLGKDIWTLQPDKITEFLKASCISTHIQGAHLYKLNLRLKKKIGVILMFSVGLFLTAVSAVRISTLIQFATTNNITSEALWVYVWSFIELCVGISVACMPNASQLWRSGLTKAKDLSAAASSKERPTSATEMIASPKRKSTSQDISLVSTAEALVTPDV
ncbi:CFEM domain-containing protein [Colletotrichum karsti]|uniref:CFEM domain-containing protein n=1 Tax=Colletotrichum karsti TaxID=1095194 RepID=A0A9P6IEM7_9PEZI|nr:CFEM domain-containing protein [Colletotrichum karsti]KAF9881034.1 CFEM domain-containing protein [Colletotrichum karsti]